MRAIARSTFALLLSTTPIALAPANAAGTDNNMMGDSMHSMMQGHITCKDAGTSDTGMMVEFHNMGSEAIPAGTTVHWMMRGMAQGDMHFMDALAPGGMKTQNYMMHDSSHMTGDSMHMGAGSMHMAGHTPCTVKMM